MNSPAGGRGAIKGAFRGLDIGLPIRGGGPISMTDPADQLINFVGARI